MADQDINQRTVTVPAWVLLALIAGLGTGTSAVYNGFQDHRPYPHTSKDDERIMHANKEERNKEQAALLRYIENRFEHKRKLIDQLQRHIDRVENASVTHEREATQWKTKITANESRSVSNAGRIERIEKSQHHHSLSERAR